MLLTQRHHITIPALLEDFMMKKLIFLFIALVATVSASFAGNLSAKHGVVKDSYNFWFYNPDSVSTKEAKPLIIFLHGSSLCGRDLNRVKRYGTIDAIEKGRELDAFVIAPQNPGGSWKPAKINAIMEWAAKNYNIDESRIYVLGMSLGGYGTLDMVAAYPDKIAAAMAFCGGTTSKNFAGMSKVPLWIVHGTADRAVSVSASDKVVAGIRQTGDDSRLIYDRVPGMNHSRPARFFYLQESYDWLFAHSLKDKNRCVNKDLTFSPDLLAGAYKDLNYGRRSKSKGNVTAGTSRKSHARAKSGKGQKTRGYRSYSKKHSKKVTASSRTRSSRSSRRNA